MLLLLNVESGDGQTQFARVTCHESFQPAYIRVATYSKYGTG